MPIPLIVVILAAVAALTVVAVAIVLYEDILQWFRSRNDIKLADKDNIAFTLKEKLSDGDYKVVEGIFNKRSDTIVDGRVLQAKRIDADLAAAHGRKKLVIYE